MTSFPTTGQLTHSIAGMGPISSLPGPLTSSALGVLDPATQSMLNTNPLRNPLAHSTNPALNMLDPSLAHLDLHQSVGSAGLSGLPGTSLLGRNQLTSTSLVGTNISTSYASTNPGLGTTPAGLLGTGLTSGSLGAGGLMNTAAGGLLGGTNTSFSSNPTLASINPLPTIITTSFDKDGTNI